MRRPLFTGNNYLVQSISSNSLHVLYHILSPAKSKKYYFYAIGIWHQICNRTLDDRNYISRILYIYIYTNIHLAILLPLKIVLLSESMPLLLNTLYIVRRCHTSPLPPPISFNFVLSCGLSNNIIISNYLKDLLFCSPSILTFCTTIFTIIYDQLVTGSLYYLLIKWAIWGSQPPFNPHTSHTAYELKSLASKYK